MDIDPEEQLSENDGSPEEHLSEHGGSPDEDLPPPSGPAMPPSGPAMPPSGPAMPTGGPAIPTGGLATNNNSPDERMAEETINQLFRDNFRRQLFLLEKTVTDACKNKACPPEPQEIQFWSLKLERLNSEIVKMDKKILKLITPDTFEDELFAQSDIQDLVMRMSIKLNQNGEKMASKGQNAAQASNAEVRTNTPAAQIKLPPLEQVKFGGNATKYFAFIQAHQSDIQNNSSLSDGEKLRYLKASLFGEALTAIEGLQMTAENYHTALKILHDRFGCQKIVIQQHLRKLQLLSKQYQINSSARSLRSLVDQVIVNVRGLETLGVHKESYCNMVYDQILLCLPNDLKKEVIKNTLHTQKLNECAGTSSAPVKHIDDLEEVINFLEIEITCRNTASGAELEYLNKKPRDKPWMNKQKSSTVLHIAEKRNFHNEKSVKKPVQHVAITCYFCDRRHPTSECNSKFSLFEKREMLKREKRCFNCTEPGHMSSECYTKKYCKICNKYRATTMCHTPDQSKSNDKPTGHAVKPEGPPTQNATALASQVTGAKTHKKFMLPLAKVMIEKHNSKSQKTVRLLMDNGSERSFITGSLARDLNLKKVGSENLQLHAFSQSLGSRSMDLVEVPLRSRFNDDIYVVNLLVVPGEISYGNTTLIPPKLEKHLNSLGLELADNTDQSDIDGQKISILIGQDYMNNLTLPNVMDDTTSQLRLTRTVFGWIVSGAIYTCHKNESVAMFNIISDDEIQNLIPNMWELSALGISDTTDDQPIDPAKVQLRSNLKRLIDGRYETSLVWNQQLNKPLQNNKTVALSRLKSTTNRLLKDPKLMFEYHNSITEYLKLGYAETIPQHELVNHTDDNTRIFYLPHQIIVRYDHITSKWRIVFDASASSSKDVFSLNQHLLTGPNVNPALPVVLLNFRTHAIALTGDITKAFLQISLRPDQRDCVRYLWYDDMPVADKPLPQIVEFRMTRLPFGLCCSPYILSDVIRYHLENVDKKYAILAEDIAKSLYVDDLIFGANTELEAIQKYHGSRKLFGEMKMDLKKWSSNSQQLQKLFEQDGTGVPKESPTAECNNSSVFKVLGIHWNNCDDFFTFDFSDLWDKPLAKTKREILSITAALYDPLGLILPYSVRAKLIIQQIWKISLDWDQEVPNEIKEEFSIWQQEMKELSQIQLNRFYFKNLKPPLKHSFHIFGDASLKAYGAVAYLRTLDSEGNINTNLLCAKSRVAPLKTITLPRLELMGSLLVSNLYKYLKDTLDLKIEDVFLWTDSEIALAWIKGEPHLRKQFVSNRISEIQRITRKEQWLHCAGELNPADLLTRGIKSKPLTTSRLWWEGPEFLLKKDSEWPKQKIHSDLSEVENENKKVITLNLNVTEDTVILPLENYSSYSKLLRVTSYVIRAINSFKGIRAPTDLIITSEEMDTAEIMCIKQVQKNAFPSEYQALKQGNEISKKSSIAAFRPKLDEHGCMVIHGRLDNLEGITTHRNPYLLPKSGPYQSLLIQHYHRVVKHMGVATTLAEIRQKYWIIKGRQITTSILRRCTICDKYRAKAASQTEAQLPASRIKEALPFQYCGVDFAGPFYTLNHKKVYLALFTCATSRAVHLELVNGLNPAQLIMAIKRFISRRGQCQLFISDNGTTFVKSAKDLELMWDNIKSKDVQEFFANWRIKWQFITPKSPKNGGFYERMIKTVKQALKKTIGNTSLSFEELSTVLAEVEATVNGRPITYVYSDAGEAEALTPSHLLIGRRPNELPMSSYNFDLDLQQESSRNMQKRYLYRKKLLEEFRKIWKDQYLLSLRSAHLSPTATAPNLKIGQVVLIQDENQPRQHWKLGIITEVFPGRDHLVRTCRVKITGGSELLRPIHLLYPLETIQED